MKTPAWAIVLLFFSICFVKETYIIENGVKKVLQANQYHYQNQ